MADKETQFVQIVEDVDQVIVYERLDTYTTTNTLFNRLIRQARQSPDGSAQAVDNEGCLVTATIFPVNPNSGHSDLRKLLVLAFFCYVALM
jgi:hypothetical protein